MRLTAAMILTFVMMLAGCSTTSAKAPVATMTTGTVCPQIDGCGGSAGTTYLPLCGSIGAPDKPPGCHI